VQEHTEHLVRSFMTNTLRFPPVEMEKMQFSNVHRLAKRESAVESQEDDHAGLPTPIFIKFVQTKDKCSILRPVACRERGQMGRRPRAFRAGEHPKSEITKIKML